MTKRQPASFSIGALTSPVCAPFVLGVAVLAAQGDGASRERRRDPAERRGRRTEHEIARRRLGLGARDERAGERHRVAPESVHLPVAGTELPHGQA